MQRSLILGALLLAGSTSLAFAQSSGTASIGGSFSASGSGYSAIGGSVSVQAGSGGTASGSLDFHYVEPSGDFNGQGPVERGDEGFDLCDLLCGLVSQADLEAAGCAP